MSLNKQSPGIEYLTDTWNPTTGCLHNCPFDCWARRTAHRMENNPKSPYFIYGFRPHFYPERLSDPLKKKKSSIIGVSFMGDLFTHGIADEQIGAVLAVCRQAHWHRFIFLTKNPKRYAEFEIPLNCWCGTSVAMLGIEQAHGKESNRMFDFLDAVPKGKRFLSFEPFTVFPHSCASDMLLRWLSNIDWLIVGGLTGKGKWDYGNYWDKLNGIDLIIKYCKDRSLPLFLKRNTKYPDYEKFQQYPEGLRL